RPRRPLGVRNRGKPVRAAELVELPVPRRDPALVVAQVGRMRAAKTHFSAIPKRPPRRSHSRMMPCQSVAGESGADRLLRAREAAELLAVSEATVWRLSRQGHLRRIRVGGSTRFAGRDVARIAARGTDGAHDEGPAGGP